MKKTVAFLSGFFCLAFTASLSAAELPVKPGMWESKMKRTNPFTGEESQDVVRSCVEEGSFDPETLVQNAEECSIDESTLSGNTLNFAMSCSAQGGAKMTIDGTYTVEGETGDGEMKMEMSMGGMNVSFSASWDAEWVGEC